MKIIVIGLGNFGMSLAVNLSNTGNEVIAADIDIEKIELIKDKVAHAVAFDAKKESAYSSLPLKNTDIVIIAMGDKDGAVITSSAIVRKLTKAKIISRASSSIEDTILKAMKVDQIIHPEMEYAERFTKTLNLSGTLDNFEVDEEYLVSEVSVIESMYGKTIMNCELRNKYNLNIITILRQQQHRNILGRSSGHKEVIGMPKPDTILEKGDILVVFGKDQDIKAFLEKNKV